MTVAALPPAQRPTILRFLREAAEDGLDLNSPTGESAISMLLAQRPGTPDKCRSCGRDGLSVLELLNGRCERCVSREVGSDLSPFNKRFRLDPDGYMRERANVVAGAVASLAEQTIPVRYAKCTRENWRGKWPLPNSVDRWPADSKPAPWAIVILGPKGTGKSHLATSLFRMAVKRWSAGGHWLDWSRTLDLVRESFGDGQHTAEERAVWSKRLLLLDDVGAERATEYTKDFANRVLRHRHAEGLPTILTTNASGLDELESFLDARVISRLAQESLIVPMGGADRRILSFPV